MASPLSIDVHSLIAEGSFRPLQKLVLFFGFCIITLEGFDLAVMGFIVPVLREQWGITNHDLGPALSAAQVGLVLGALSAGPVADRFGRKIVILVSMAIFGVATLATASAEGLTQLVLFRFLTGLGAGSVVPNTATLVAEYMPERIRSFSVALIICGVAFSSACAGFLSAWMIPHYGWQSVLLLGGTVPLLMIPVLAFLLPESVRFLVASRAPAPRIRALIDRMAPGTATAGSVFAAAAEPDEGGATKLLFSRRYLFGSAMLWIAYFAALFASNILSHWMPTIIKGAGYSLSEAAIVAAVYHVGGVVGALLLGWGMDRYEIHRVPTVAYLVSGLLFVVFGATLGSETLMLVLAFVLGFCLIGAISCINSLPTVFYPTKARATGGCWMHGAGRSGALVSIFCGAQMLTLGWSADSVFTVLLIPSLAAAGALFLKGRYASPLAD